jgi:hypothetical protein
MSLSAAISLRIIEIPPSEARCPEWGKQQMR